MGANAEFDLVVVDLSHSASHNTAKGTFQPVFQFKAVRFSDISVKKASA